MTVLTNKERLSMAKSPTTKTRLKVTRSVPLLPPGTVPQLTKSPSSCSHRGDASSRSSKRAAAGRIILQPGNLSAVCENTHSSKSKALPLNQHPMNSVLIDTPEPYLEPIKTLSFGNTSRAPSRVGSRKYQHTVAVGLLPSPPASEISTSDYTLGGTSAVDYYKPIPPPKVVVQTQRARGENNQGESKEALELRQKKKHSELAYLIVDLDAVGCPIISEPESDYHENQKTLDDSHLQLKSQPVEEDNFPLRASTMSNPSGHRPPRPKPPPKLRHKSKDSPKEIPPTSNGLERDNKVPNSTSAITRTPEKESKDKPVAEESQDSKPIRPPRRKPPPRPVIGKMVSLPPYLSPPNRTLPGEQRKGSAPALPSKGGNYADKKRTRALTSSTESLDSTTSSDVFTSPVELTRDFTQRIPPPKPKPYAQRNSTTPPPPSFRPPSPLAHSLSVPVTGIASKSGESSDVETSRKTTLRHSDSESRSKSSPSATRPKPLPPSRPPPPNPRLQGRISEMKLKSKSTSDIKQGSKSASPSPSDVKQPPLSQLNTRRTSGPRPEISEPQLISSTVSRTLSFTEINKESPDYEDVDSFLPPPVPNKLSKSKSPTPYSSRKSPVESAPDLPPRGSRTDPVTRRVAISPLFAKVQVSSSLSVSSIHKPQTDRESSPQTETSDPVYDPLVKYQPLLNQSRDCSDADYEIIDLSDDENNTTTEPDIGGVDDYVAMNPVSLSAWEDAEPVVVKESPSKEKMVSMPKMEEDQPEDSYVEMHPADQSSLTEEEENLYWNDDPNEDPVYIVMDPQEFIPPPKLYYASKDLLTKRPDLRATKKKPKPLKASDKSS